MQGTRAEDVKARLLHVRDLPAAEAVYHQTCSVNFRTKKQIPQVYALNQPPSKRGGPKDDVK